jgi:hypothetical protein
LIKVVVCGKKISLGKCLCRKADVILNIPLSPNLPQDRLIWKDTKDGKFTVRSAYHLGYSLHDNDRGQSSSGASEQGVWKLLWSLRVPNQVKVFTWWALHDILPTRVNLVRRKVIEDNLCPVCKTERETVIHVLWTCPVAQDVWRGSLSNFQKCGTNYSSFLTLFEDFQVRFKKETMELMVITARRLWLRRNSFIFEGVFSSPSNILARAKVTLEEFTWCSNPDQSTFESNAEPPV